MQFATLLLILSLLHVISLCYAAEQNLTSSNCGGNCPSVTCDTCPCGNVAVYADAATWCSKYSWNQANCVCIMQHESGYNQNAMHQNADGHIDVGLWQINDFNWEQCNGSKAPCDPQQNLNCAIDVYNWGDQTWKFWDTCGLCNACDQP